MSRPSAGTTNLSVWLIVWELEMSERRITQLFGLGLGAIITCTMVLNAFAF